VLPKQLTYISFSQILDIGENRRLKPAFLAAFFAFDKKVCESNVGMALDGATLDQVLQRFLGRVPADA